MATNISMLPQAEGSATKKPFTPSSSTRTPFSRTDSRGEYQLGAAVPEEVHVKLQSVGMRARMAVNRGYDPSLPLANISSSNTNNASLEGSSRCVWSRVQSAPNYTKELQPFSEILVPSHSFSTGATGWSDAILEEDGMSIASGSQNSGVSRKRGNNAEDVLGDFMSDDEESGGDENVFSSEGVDMMMMTDNRPSNPLRPIKTLPTSSNAPNPFPRRTFTQSQTLPASATTLRYLSGGGGPIFEGGEAIAAEDPEEEPKWRAIRFEEFVKKDDF